MPDVISNQPADVRLWVSLDVHKLSIVAAVLPPIGGQPEVQRIETTRAAVRRFIERLVIIIWTNSRNWSQNSSARTRTGWCRSSYMDPGLRPIITGSSRI